MRALWLHAPQSGTLHGLSIAPSFSPRHLDGNPLKAGPCDMHVSSRCCTIQLGCSNRPHSASRDRPVKAKLDSSAQL